MKYKVIGTIEVGLNTAISVIPTISSLIIGSHIVDESNRDYLVIGVGMIHYSKLDIMRDESNFLVEGSFNGKTVEHIE